VENVKTFLAWCGKTYQFAPFSPSELANTSATDPTIKDEALTSVLLGFVKRSYLNSLNFVANLNCSVYELARRSCTTVVPTFVLLERQPAATAAPRLQANAKAVLQHALDTCVCPCRLRLDADPMTFEGRAVTVQESGSTEDPYEICEGRNWMPLNSWLQIRDPFVFLIKVAGLMSTHHTRGVYTRCRGGDAFFARAKAVFLSGLAKVKNDGSFVRMFSDNTSSGSNKKAVV
jgi:hypothetical protein